MSLQVWLPLNGDLTNNGLSNVTVTCHGATVDNNGKIGKCYSFANGNTLFCTETILQKTQDSYSIAVWAKGYGCLYSQRPEVNSVHRCIFIYSQNRVLFDEGNRWDASVIYNGNNWNHFVFVKDGTKRYIYINGQLAGSNSNASTPQQVSTGFFIGDSQQTATTTSGNPFNGKLNDFRIYDHALSSKEVKEISKALVLHYRLSGPGQENLTKGNNTYSRNSASTDGNFWFSGSNFNCKPSTAYTLSIDIDGTISDFHGGNANTDPTKKWASMWFYVCKTGTSTNAATGGYDSAVLLNATRHNFRKIGETRYAWTYTTPDDARSLSIRGNTYSNGTDATKVNFWNPKVEEGTVATPWCPRSDEHIYSTLGYDNNIEYDCGLTNIYDGIINGKLSYSFNTPRYNTCMKFDGNNYIYASNVDKLYCAKDELTVNVWVYKNDWSISSGTFFSCIQGGGYGWQASSGGKYQVYVGTGVSENSYISKGLNTDTLQSGWHMFTITYDGFSSRVYIDAVLTNTLNKYSQKTPLFYNNASGLFIGGESNGSLTNPSDKFTGMVSDVRIYATPLLYEDILELYRSSAFIDNKNNAYVFEYIEGD